MKGETTRDVKSDDPMEMRIVLVVVALWWDHLTEWLTGRRTKYEKGTDDSVCGYSECGILVSDCRSAVRKTGEYVGSGLAPQK
jgi:hypothetical protein